MQMPSLSSPQVLLALLLSFAAVACGPPNAAAGLADVGPIEGPFLVSDYFTPSGYMGDGQFAGRITASINSNCKERPDNAQGDCYRFIYKPGDKLWAGVYWVYPSNSWGAYPGRWVSGPVDLGNGQRGYNSVTFSVATDLPLFQTDPPQEPTSANFLAGGIDGAASVPPLPYADTTCLDGDCEPFKAQRGATLSTDWQTVTINLSGKPLTSVIGAFAWVTSYPSNTDPTAVPPKVIYIDNLVWE